MQNKIITYRDNAKPNTIEKFGDGLLIRSPPKAKPLKLHQCKIPGFWKKLFNGIKHNDLWRCGVCEMIWVAVEYKDWFGSYWQIRGQSFWDDAIKYKDNV
jgi:hypothetical protein